VIAIRPIALLDLLQALDLHEQRLFLCNLGCGEMV
jgi:hypothetical protein